MSTMEGMLIVSVIAALVLFLTMPDDQNFD